MNGFELWPSASEDLDISDAMGLFSVLDSDGTGAIEHAEFLVGCLRLRGGAKAVDMVRVQMEQEWMHNALLQMRQMMQELYRWREKERLQVSESGPPPGAEESDLELSDQLGASEQIFPKLSESHVVADYRTNLAAEERAVSLQELKRISSDASHARWEA